MLADRTDLLPDRTPVPATGVAISTLAGAPHVLVAGHGEANRLFRGAPADATGGAGETLVDVVGELRAATASGANPDGEGAPVADPDGRAVGVAAADVDGDGVEELYVHNAGPFARSVLDPDAEGGLGSPQPDRLLDPHGVSAAGDPSPDGWLDLLADGRNRRGRNLRVGRAVAALDRTGDGTYAFLVTGDASPARLQTVAAGSVTDCASAVGVDFLGGGRSVLAGPVRPAADRDGDVPDDHGVRMDLLLGMERGPNLLLRNDGGGFTDFAPEVGVSDTHGDARGAALVDLGGATGLALGTDGDRNRLWRLGDGRAVDVTPEPFAEPGPVRTVLAADLDNDGREELFVTCHGAPNRLLQLAGTGRDGPTWEPVDPGPAAEPDRPSTGAVAADLDGDGALELLVAHGGPEAEPLAVYGAPGVAGNDWLRVRPRTAHGAPARGAVVTLIPEDGRVQRRVVDAGSGYCCQGEPVAHFGLGDGSPRAVRVAWPDGETAATMDVPEPNQVLDVPFPG